MTEPDAPDVGRRAHATAPLDADPVSMAALTPGQALFARQVGATSLIDPAEAGGPVFLYRDDELMTQRWLGDRDGKVLDTACFHRSWA